MQKFAEEKPPINCECDAPESKDTHNKLAFQIYAATFVLECKLLAAAAAVRNHMSSKENTLTHTHSALESRTHGAIYYVVRECVVLHIVKVTHTQRIYVILKIHYVMCINMRWLHSCHTGFMSKSSLLSPNAAAAAAAAACISLFLSVFALRGVILHKTLWAVRKETWLFLLVGKFHAEMSCEQTNKRTQTKWATKQWEKQTSAPLWQWGELSWAELIWVLSDDVICGHIKNTNNSYELTPHHHSSTQAAVLFVYHKLR